MKNLALHFGETSSNFGASKQNQSLNSSSISGVNLRLENRLGEGGANQRGQEKSRVKRKIFEDDDDPLENVYRAKVDLDQSELNSRIQARKPLHSFNKPGDPRFRSESQSEAQNLKSQKSSFQSNLQLNEAHPNTGYFYKQEPNRGMNLNKKDNSVSPRGQGYEAKFTHLKTRSIFTHNGSDNSRNLKPESNVAQQALNSGNIKGQTYPAENIRETRPQGPYNSQNDQFSRPQQNTIKIDGRYDPVHIQRNLQPTMSSQYSKPTSQGQLNGFPRQQQGSFVGSDQFNQRYNSYSNNLSNQDHGKVEPTRQGIAGYPSTYAYHGQHAQHYLGH